MRYICLKNQQFVADDYQLVSVRHQDILLIKQWRNEQIDILRQHVPLTDAMQEAYFENIIKPSFVANEPKQILFSFLENNVLIGYGGIVHIDWNAKQGEISFLVDTKRSKDLEIYKKDFSHYLRLIKQLAFQDLHFQRLYTETFDMRPLHISILENSGFVLERRLKNWVKIQEKSLDVLIHGCNL